MKRWIAKYNVSQKKKFLETKRQAFLVEKRNKLFTNWMKEASESMNNKIFEASLAQEHLFKLKKKIFEVIRFNFIKRKRENIMSQII